VDEIVVHDPSATPLAGVVVVDGKLFAFDRLAANVLQLDTSGAIVQRIGRAGEGPGEFAAGNRSGTLSRAGRARDWLGATADTLVVLDGNAFHRFTTDGRFLGSLRVPETILGGPSVYPRVNTRMRVDGREVLLDIAQLTREGGGRGAPLTHTYSLWIVADTNTRRVLQVRLASPPMLANGAVDISGREARPTFDRVGRCVVVSDGGSPFLIVGRVDGPRVDTIPIRLPLRDPVASEDEAAARRAMGGSAPVEPTLPARVQRLIADPDGWVWLQTVQPPQLDGAIEIVRVQLGTGRQRTDTVPFFPSVFLGNGGMLGVRVDSSGSARLQFAHPAHGLLFERHAIALRRSTDP
jgi:hypothetical protein